MATGPEHYLEAERMRAAADEWADADLGWKATLTAQERINQRLADLADAQVHATLALAAATALGTHGGMDYLDHEAWDRVAGVQEKDDEDDPYEGLTNADVLTADELYGDERAAEAELDAADEDRYAEENAASRYDDEHFDVDDEDVDGGDDE